MNPAFLTEAAVNQLCDPLSQAAAQCRWLKGQGIPFLRSPSGRPVVLRTSIAEIFFLPSSPGGDQPDMGALLHAIEQKRKARQRTASR